MLAALLLALLPGPDGVPGPDWVEVDLPLGMRLDLAQGVVSNRVAADAGLEWRDGRLESGVPLRLLPRDERGGAAAVVAPDAGRPWGQGAVEPGDEFVFALPDGGWGYLAVRGTGAMGLRLEHTVVPAGVPRLVREPAEVRAELRAGRVTLAWDAAEGAQYRVVRHIVGTPDESSDLVTGGGWSDPLDAGSRLLDFRVVRVGAPLGSRVRTHRVVLAHEEDVPLARGSRIDLLTGEVDGERGDVEVTYLNPPSVALRPLERTGLEPILGPGEPWVLPAPGPGRYLGDRIRTIDLATDLAVRLREDVYARVRLVAAPDGRVTLRRQVDPEGGRVLPLAPTDPRVKWMGGREGGVSVSFPPLGSEVPDGELVRLVAEREVQVAAGAGTWREVDVSPPGGRALLLGAGPRADDAPPLVRYRFRHRTADGRLSFASDPVTVLLGDPDDPEQVRAWLDAAFADLVHPEFERRAAAREVIAALGSSAWPRLEQALLADDPELAGAARDLLTSSAREGGRQAELLLRTEARRAEVSEPAPDGLYDPDPQQRALVLLRTWGAADDEAARAWARVLQRADPDPTVAALADVLSRSPRVGLALAPGEPAVVCPPIERPRVDALDALRAEDADAHALSILVRRAVDPYDFEAAWVQLALAGALGAGADVRTLRARREDDARLALRLVERWRGGAPDELLDAARALVGGPLAEFLAWRELCALRLSAPPPPSARPRLELESPSWSELEGRLATLASEGDGYVDLVLPPGVYEPTPGRQGGLEIASPGVRLLARDGGTVELVDGVRVRGVRDVVLQGLTLTSETGSPFSITGSEVTLVDCRVSGAQAVLIASGGRIELDRVVCTVPGELARPRWTARLTGGADLVARGSLLAAGTIASAPGSRMYIELSVIDSGPQTAFQGQGGGDVLVLRDCLLRGEGIGLAAIERGLAAGVVFDFVRDPVLSGSCGVLLSPELSAFSERTPPADPLSFLPRCPLAKLR